MSGKKVSVNLTEANYAKVTEIVKTSGITQTEFINQALAGVPVIMLGNRKTLAECFFDLRRMIASFDYKGFEKEVNEICQSLNLVMEKIEDLNH